MGCLDVWCYRRAGSCPGGLAFEPVELSSEAAVASFGVAGFEFLLQPVFPLVGFGLAGEAHPVLGVLDPPHLVVLPCGDQLVDILTGVRFDFGAGVIPACFAVVLRVDGGDDGCGEFGCVDQADDGVVLGWFGALLVVQGAAHTSTLAEFPHRSSPIPSSRSRRLMSSDCS